VPGQFRITRADVLDFPFHDVRQGIVHACIAGHPGIGVAQELKRGPRIQYRSWGVAWRHTMSESET
jgi:hypothetical protein